MKSKKKIQFMAIMSMLIAIEIVLMFTPFGYLRIGPLSATLMHIPVIIAGITLGVKGGAMMGLVMGITSVINATIAPGITSFAFSPAIPVIGTDSGSWLSLIVAIGPRILIGIISAYTYKLLKNINKPQIAILCASIAGTLTNTVLVLGGIYVIFGEAYATAVNASYDALAGILLGVVATNGMFEVVIACIVNLVVCNAIKPYINKYN